MFKFSFAHLDFSVISFFLFFAFGSVFLPARAGEIISPSVTAPLPARSAPEEIAGRIGAFNQRFRQGWNAGLWEALGPLYAKNAFMLPPEKPVLSGREAILAQYREDHKSGVVIQVLKNTPTHIWTAGDLVVTAGEAVMSYTLPGRPTLVSEYSKVVDVWSRRPDGSLGLVVDSWVGDRGADRPAGAAGATPLEDLSAPAAAPEELQAIFERIRRMEIDFHRLQLRDPVQAAAAYATDALLIDSEARIFTGGDKIRERAKEMARTPPFADLGHQVLAVGGNAGLIYVIESFNWIMKDAGGGAPRTLPGKGIHLWMRAGESWVLALELFNTDAALTGK